MGLSNVSSLLDLRLCICVRNIPDAMRLFSEPHVKRHMMPFCPIHDGVSFDPLVKVVSARFLHCKMTNFSFVVSILWGDTLRLYSYLVSHPTVAH